MIPRSFHALLPSSLGLLLFFLSSPAFSAPPPGQSAYLRGMHDIEALSWMQQASAGCDKGWITTLNYIGIQGNPAIDCHTQATQAGISIIQRLDASGSESYPHDPAQAPGYAASFAAYVAQCSAIRVWIVGNEPNFTVHKSDPDCSSAAYAKSYVEVYRRVKALPGRQNDLLLVASNSPYSPGCVESLRSILRAIQAQGIKPDGVALHAYTRAPNAGSLQASLVTSTQTQQDATRKECPGSLTWNDTWHSHFRIYRDYIQAIEQLGLTSLPIFITESGNACDPTPGNACYPHADVGYFQALYSEADQWNKLPTTKTLIRAITPYRWTINDDGTGRDFAIGSKPGLLGDLQKAFTQGHAWTSPSCGGCQKDADCPSGQTCDLATKTCKAPSCQGPQDCPSMICSPLSCLDQPGRCVEKGTGRFSLPSPLLPQSPFSVDFSHKTGWAHIGLSFCGPTQGEGIFLQVKNNGQEFTWIFSLPALPVGRYRAFFSADQKSKIIGSTEFLIAPPCTPAPEVCGDGQDNDCDGKIDEGCVPSEAKPEPLTEATSERSNEPPSERPSDASPSESPEPPLDRSSEKTAESPESSAPEILLLESSKEAEEARPPRPRGCGCQTHEPTGLLLFFVVLLLASFSPSRPS